MHGKTDDNQAEIVNTLRSIGMTVADLSQVGAGVPDLLVGAIAKCPHCAKGFRQNLLIEVKSSEKAALTPAQKEFHLLWRGQLLIVRSVEDVLALAKKSSLAPADALNQQINLNQKQISVTNQNQSKEALLSLMQNDFDRIITNLKRDFARIISEVEKLA